jgi:hypothetical protein
MNSVDRLSGVVPERPVDWIDLLVGDVGDKVDTSADQDKPLDLCNGDAVLEEEAGPFRARAF